MTLSKDMTWKTHVSQVITKANRSLGFLKRNLQIRSPDIKEKAYFGLVRPQVEYASSVWDPYHKNQVHSIEMIQRRAARWVLNRYHNTSSVTDMLQHLGWQTLQQRRQNAHLVNFYKMSHGLVVVSPSQYSTPINRATRHHHQYNYVQIPAKAQSYQYSFYPRTIVQWNALPLTVVQAGTLDSFRSRLVAYHGLPHLPL